jgi:hypothetical protein
MDAPRKVLHVPVQEILQEGKVLLSRAQARRLCAGFRELRLDFTGITQVGPAFADELFRVYVLEHPDLVLEPVAMNPAVEQAVRQAQAAARDSWD